MKSLTEILSSAALGISLFISGCMLSHLPYVYKKLETIETVSVYPRETSDDLNYFLTARDSLDFISADKSVSSYTLKQTKQGSLKIIKWNSQAERKPDVLIYLNGLESHGRWFSQVASQLAEQGIETHALDRRGSGVNMRIYGKGEDWISDIDKLVMKLRKEEQANIHIVSLCFGAKLATAYVSLHPNKISSLIYISPGIETKIKPSCLEKLTIGFATIFNNPYILVDSPIKDINLFSQDKEVLDTIKKDRLRIIAPRATDLFYGYDLLKKSRKTGKIIPPVLILYSDKDRISDIPANFGFFTKFSSLIESKNFPDCQHSLPLEAPGKVSQVIADWLRRY